MMLGMTRLWVRVVKWFATLGEYMDIRDEMNRAGIDTDLQRLVIDAYKDKLSHG